jgi:hypothetical protein
VVSPAAPTSFRSYRLLQHGVFGGQEHCDPKPGAVASTRVGESAGDGVGEALCLSGRPLELYGKINRDGLADDPAAGAGQASPHVIAVVRYRDHYEAHLTGFQEIAHTAKLVSRDIIPEATHNDHGPRPFGVGG